MRYYALAENVRHPGKGYVEARVVHSFGRADRLDRAALERLVASIRRVLEDAGGEAGARDGSSVGGIAIEAAFELGVVHVARALWAKLGIGEAIQARHSGTAAAGAARRRPPGHGGAAPRPARLQARLPRALARPGVAARGARPRPVPALPRPRSPGRARRRRRAGGVLARGRSLQARRRPGLLRRDHRLVRDRRGGRRRPRVARADLRAAAPARAQQGGAGQRPAGGDRARGHPRRRAGAVLGLPGRHARRHHRADDQGRPARDAARPGPVRRRRRAVLEGQPGRAGQGGRALRPGRADRAGEGDPGRGPVPSRAVTPTSRPACGPRRWCSARASAAGATSCA